MVIGKMIKDMVKEFKHGQIMRNMMVNGQIINKMAKAN